MLAANDAAAVKGADKAVAALPSVDDCGANEPAAPLPAAPALRETVDQLRDELAAADTFRLVGKFAEANAALDALAPRITLAGYKPLDAELLYTRAMNARGASSDPKALPAVLREVVSLAEASGNDVLVINAWSALANDAAGIQGDFERAREYAGYAKAALDRVGGSRRLEARLATMRGDLEWRDHKHEAARRAYERAVELTTENPAAQADAIAGLSKVDTRDGHLADALARAQKALDLRRDVYGVDSIPVARSHMALSEIQARLGQLRPALDHLRKADALVQQLYGPAHFMNIYTSNDLAGVLLDLGEYRDAEVSARRAVEISTAAYGADDVTTAKVRQTLGMALREQGRNDEAIRELERAIEGKRKKWGADHAETLSATNHLAIALRQAGRVDEAIQMGRTTADKLVAALGPDNIEVGETLASLAAAYLAAHRTADAADARERAKEIFVKNEIPPDKIEEKLERATR
jgi:tetratricopeptide (TPR) repeat protein